MNIFTLSCMNVKICIRCNIKRYLHGNVFVDLNHLLWYLDMLNTSPSVAK